MYTFVLVVLLISFYFHPDVLVFFFFNDTATTEIYTLSLHDALPISCRRARSPASSQSYQAKNLTSSQQRLDRKSTRLNSSHANISYAVFCLKKKKRKKKNDGNNYDTRTTPDKNDATEPTHPTA